MSDGQSNQSANEMEIEAEIERARQALSLKTNDGYKAAFAIIIPALDKAAACNLPEKQITLFCLLGDLYMAAKKYETAHSAYTDAIHIEGAIGDPEVHYRLGTTNYELQNHDRAADEFARAYMGAGKDIFEAGDETYFDFLKSRLKSPPDGW